eukprot:15366389-Ditylum_brightwellii.AAC.4
MGNDNPEHPTAEGHAPSILQPRVYCQICGHLAEHTGSYSPTTIIGYTDLVDQGRAHNFFLSCAPSSPPSIPVKVPSFGSQLYPAFLSHHPTLTKHTSHQSPQLPHPIMYTPQETCHYKANQTK